MSDVERPDLAPDDLTPRGYVKMPGGGRVHVGVLAAAGVLAWLAWKFLR